MPTLCGKARHSGTADARCDRVKSVDCRKDISQASHLAADESRFSYSHHSSHPSAMQFNLYSLLFAAAAAFFASTNRAPPDASSETYDICITSMSQRFLERL